MSAVGPEPLSITMRRIWTPSPALGFSGLLLVVFTFFLGLIIGAVILAGIRPIFGESQATVLITVISILCLLSPIVVLLWFANQWHKSKILSKPLFRTRRLERIVAAAPGDNRHRHRVAENILRGKVLTRSVAKRLTNVLEPGDILCVNPPRDEPGLRVTQNSSRFEPMDIDDDDERLELFVSSGHAMDADLPPQAAGAGFAKRAAGALKSLLKQLFVWAWLLFWAFYILRSLYFLITQGATKDSYPAMFIALLCIYGAFMATMFEEKTWIVPGGLIYRYAPFYRRTPLVEYYEPGSTPLVIDWRSNVCVVWSRGRPNCILCPDLAAAAVLLAWASTAPAPTLQEVRSFLGVSREE